MKQDYTKAKVGQVCYWTDANRSGLFEGLIDKVGRKLIHVRNGGQSIAFRVEDGYTNDAYRHKYLIVDKEAYDLRQKTKVLSSKLDRARALTLLSFEQLQQVENWIGAQ